MTKKYTGEFLTDPLRHFEAARAHLDREEKYLAHHLDAMLVECGERSVLGYTKCNALPAIVVPIKDAVVAVREDLNLRLLSGSLGPLIVKSSLDEIERQLKAVSTHTPLFAIDKLARDELSMLGIGAHASLLEITMRVKDLLGARTGWRAVSCHPFHDAAHVRASSLTPLIVMQMLQRWRKDIEPMRQ